MTSESPCRFLLFNNWVFAAHWSNCYFFSSSVVFFLSLQYTTLTQVTKLLFCTCSVFSLIKNFLWGWILWYNRYIAVLLLILLLLFLLLLWILSFLLLSLLLLSLWQFCHCGCCFYFFCGFFFCSFNCYFGYWFCTHFADHKLVVAANLEFKVPAVSIWYFVF